MQRRRPTRPVTVHPELRDDLNLQELKTLSAVLAQISQMPVEDKIIKRPQPAPRIKQALDWSLPGFEGKARVTTNFGELPIEALRRRDMVKTISGAYREVQWVDTIRLDVDFMELHPEAAPILIRERAMGGLYPRRNILVSPGQPLRYPHPHGDTMNLTAGEVVGQPNILRMHRSEITYYRFHCGTDETVCVEGSWFHVSPPK